MQWDRFEEGTIGFGQIISFMANPISQSRSEQREPRSLSLEILPLDDDFQPAGNPFWSVSRDVSVQGLGVLNARQNPAPLFEDKPVRQSVIGDC